VKRTLGDSTVVCAAGVRRSRVASLLLVVLIDKLDYVTESVVLCSVLMMLMMINMLIRQY